MSKDAEVSTRELRNFSQSPKEFAVSQRWSTPQQHCTHTIHPVWDLDSPRPVLAEMKESLFLFSVSFLLHTPFHVDVFTEATAVFMPATRKHAETTSSPRLHGKMLLFPDRPTDWGRVQRDLITPWRAQSLRSQLRESSEETSQPFREQHGWGNIPVTVPKSAVSCCSLLLLSFHIEQLKITIVHFKNFPPKRFYNSMIHFTAQPILWCR